MIRVGAPLGRVVHVCGMLLQRLGSNFRLLVLRQNTGRHTSQNNSKAHIADLLNVSSRNFYLGCLQDPQQADTVSCVTKLVFVVFPAVKVELFLVDGTWTWRGSLPKAVYRGVEAAESREMLYKSFRERFTFL